MEELLNKELTYGQLTRGVLKEEPKRGDSKEKQLKIIKSLCKIKTKEIITGKKKNYAYIIEEIYQEPKEIIDNRKSNKGRPTKYLDYTLPILLSILSKNVSIIQNPDGEKEEEVVCYKGTMSDAELFYKIFGFTTRVYPNKLDEEVYKAIPKKAKNKWRLEVLDSLYTLEYNILHSGTLELIAKRYDSDIKKLIRCFKEVTVVDGDYSYTECIGDLDIYEKVKKLEDTWRENNTSKNNIKMLSEKERDKMREEVSKQLDLKSYQRVNSIEIYLNEGELLDTISEIKNEFRNKVFSEFINSNLESITSETKYVEYERVEMAYKIDLFNIITKEVFECPTKENCMRYKNQKKLLATLKHANKTIQKQAKEIEEQKKEISALKAENQMLKNKLQNQQN